MGVRERFGWGAGPDSSGARCVDRWRARDRYGWMVGYLRGRGLATRVRLVIVAASIGYMVLPLSMLYSPAGPHGPWPRAAVITAATAVLISAAAMSRRWPTRRWSVIRVVIAAIGTTTVCISYTDVVVGLIGATTFAMLGGYVAFFHSLRLQVFNLALGLLTATMLATRALLGTRDVIVTANLYLVVVVTIVALPVTAQVLAHFLGSDLDASDTDHLTGLLNRRAFYRATHHLLATITSPTDHFSVLMIDLDDFKALNDTHGHRAGDTALVEVGRLLDQLTSDRAVVARIGGEEFLIADLTDSSTATRCAAHLCATIAGTVDIEVTASIGIATTVLPAARFGDDHTLIEHLIDLADTAMYTAKRNGGNQFHTTP